MYSTTMMGCAAAAFMALLGAFQPSSVAAHEVQRAPAGVTAATPRTILWRDPQPVIAARYEVSVLPAKGSAKARQTHTWYFFRDAQRVAVVKGDSEEAWFRDAQERVRFERTFHDEQRVVEYSTGELATLGVTTDWQAIATFIDARELALLEPMAARGGDSRAAPVLVGKVGAATLRVQWMPDLQLPALAERREADGSRVRLVLKQSASPAPATWPQPGVRGADYLRIDAADFGDMAQDPTVRKAEAMDVSIGWRSSQHRR